MIIKAIKVTIILSSLTFMIGVCLAGAMVETFLMMFKLRR